VEALEKPGGSLEDIYLLTEWVFKSAKDFVPMLDFWHTQKRQQHFWKGIGRNSASRARMTMPDIGVADYVESEVQ
jgi:hypothetical protein